MNEAWPGLPFNLPETICLATGMLWHVPVIQTTDPDLLRLDQLEGNPPITVRKPLYEGAEMLLGNGNPLDGLVLSKETDK